jgi:hypothetical protein
MIDRGKVCLADYPRQLVANLLHMCALSSPISNNPPPHTHTHAHTDPCVHTHARGQPRLHTFTSSDMRTQKGNGDIREDEKATYLQPLSHVANPWPVLLPSTHSPTYVIPYSCHVASPCPCGFPARHVPMYLPPHTHCHNMQQEK